MKIKNRKKGFTMIELAIATSILSIIFGGMTLFGVQVVKGNKRNQDLKNTVENVSYAIEFISKITRTSHDVVSSNSKELFIKDNQEKKAYCYLIDGQKLIRRSGDISKNNCSELDSSSNVEVAGNDNIEIDGEFKVVETTSTKRGFVQMTIILKNKKTAINFSDEDDQMVVQTLVSLRDYGF